MSVIGCIDQCYKNMLKYVTSILYTILGVKNDQDHKNNEAKDFHKGTGSHDSNARGHL